METKIVWINDPIQDILAGWTAIPLPCNLVCDAYCEGYGTCWEKCGVLCRQRT
jgi:hypothetical protein